MTDTYEIQSVRLKHLGAVGDTIELTKEEFSDTHYNMYLHRMEGKPVTKKSSKKKPKKDKDEDIEEI